MVYNKMKRKRSLKITTKLVHHPIASKTHSMMNPLTFADSARALSPGNHSFASGYKYHRFGNKIYLSDTGKALVIRR